MVPVASEDWIINTILIRVCSSNKNDKHKLIYYRIIQQLNKYTQKNDKIKNYMKS